LHDALPISLDAIAFELKMLQRVTNSVVNDHTAVTLMGTSIKEIEVLVKGAKQNINTKEFVYEVSVMEDVRDKIAAIKSAREILGLSLGEAKTFVEGGGDKVRRCVITREIPKEEIERYAKNRICV